MNKKKINFLLTYLEFLGIFFILNIFLRSLFAAVHYQSFFKLSAPSILNALVGGLRFDLAVSAIGSLLVSFILWISLFSSKFNFKILSSWIENKKKPLFYLIPFFIFYCTIVFFFIGDLLYFMDSGRHITYEARNAQEDTLSLLRTGLNISPMIDIFALILIAISFLFIKKIRTRLNHRNFNGKLLLTAELLVIVSLSTIAIRGGFSDEIPLQPANIFDLPESEAKFAWNSAYTISFYLTNRLDVTEIKLVAMPPETLTKNLEQLYPRAVTLQQPYSTPVKANIVFLVLESWPAEIMASYEGPHQTTPFFDELRTRSLSPTLTLSNGHRSPEGVFAAMCSFPNPLGQMVVETNLMFNEYQCLPKVLQKEGWSSSYIQGTRKTTVGMDDLVKMIGFEKSYGWNEIQARIETGPTHNFGLFDRDIYQFAVKEAKSLTEPFLLGVHTNTLHVGSYLPKNEPAPFSSHLENLLLFADKTLKEFFSHYNKLELKYPTIFVLVADHTNDVHTSNLNEYRIPLLITGPLVPASTLERVTSHLDIAPTILDLLRLQPLPFYVGKSLVRSDDEPYFSSYYHQGTLGWLTKDLLLEVNPHLGKLLNCYAWQTDFLLQSPIPCSKQAETYFQESLAFTAYTQKLLSAGQVLLFGKFRSNKEE